MKSEMVPSGALSRPTTLNVSRLVSFSSSARRSAGVMAAALDWGGMPVGAGAPVAFAGAAVAFGAAVLFTAGVPFTTGVDAPPGALVGAEAAADWQAARPRARTRQTVC